MEFKWEKIGSRDWKCVLPNNSMLRAEHMDRWYWWCVYIDGYEAESCYSPWAEKQTMATTSKQAKKQRDWLRWLTLKK